MRFLYTAANSPLTEARGQAEAEEKLGSYCPSPTELLVWVLRHFLHVHDCGPLHAEALSGPPPRHQRQRLLCLRLLCGRHHTHGPRSGGSLSVCLSLALEKCPLWGVGRMLLFVSLCWASGVWIWVSSWHSGWVTS